MAKPRMMFYTDARHPLVYMYEPSMQREELESVVDELAGTPIEALMFCLGDGRTVQHDTNVGELWGHNVDKWQHLIFRRAYQNVKSLITEGNDPLRVICDRAHAKGILLYPTLLVQLESGVRGGSGYDIRSSNFRLDNKHLEIGANNDLDPSFPGLHCADFKHEEVRRERFSLIEEAMMDYPVDGFELQLNFWPYYFHPNEVETGRKIMTDWIGRVHEVVKRSGRDRELAITIPANLNDCLSVGLDPEDWIKRDIVDVLTGQTRSQPQFQDPNSTFINYEPAHLDDMRALVHAARGSACRIHASIDSTLDSDRLAEAPIEMVRAAACNYWAQDIDGLYLSQWFGMWPYTASFYEQIRELPHPDVMAAKDKFYHIPTFSGRYPRRELTRQLPAEFVSDESVLLQITISDELHRWNKAGRVHEVFLRIRISDTTERVQLGFNFNGKALPASLLRKINQMYTMSAPRYHVGGYWFVYRLDQDHWPVAGRNTLEVTLLESDPDITPRPSVRDVEIEIKYLMGRNFHRGFVDAELEPYDHKIP